MSPVDMAPPRRRAVLNVHRRTFDVAPERLAPLLEGLATGNDLLWPHERWPRMDMQPALQRGAKGGHGPIRYFVADHQPGRSVRFRFSAPAGFDGEHEFVIERSGAAQCVLAHILQMDVHGIKTKLAWFLFYRPLHDALIEDALDKSEAWVAGRAWQPRALSLHVRALRALAR